MFAAIFAIGGFFALVFARSGNLWIVGVFHAIGNAAFGAIHDNLQTLKVHLPGQRPLDELDVPPFRVVDPEGFAHCICSRAQVLDFAGNDQRLHPRFHFVRKLEPVARKKLDPIILVGIMRGRDNDSRIRSETPGHKRNRGSRHGPDQKHIHTHRADAGRQGRFQHIAGQSSVFPDDDLMTSRSSQEEIGGSPSKLHRRLTGHRFQVRDTPDAVCPEQLTHSLFSVIRHES